MILVLIIIFIAFIAIGCSTIDEKTLVAIGESNKPTNEYKNITPSDAKRRLIEEKEIILLDVRTIEEYEVKHIPGSVLIPVEVIDKEAKEKLKDKTATIFIYCRSGRRSVTASEILVKQGYTNVFNLGGINNWPYETETGAAK